MFTRAHVSDMFYNAEMEMEIRDRPQRIQWLWKNDCDREEFMIKVIEEAASSTYTHLPAPECPQKGTKL